VSAEPDSLPQSTATELDSREHVIFTCKRTIRRRLVVFAGGVTVASLGVGAAFLVLLFRTPKLPAFANDPSAIRRLARKIDDTRAVTAGRPHILHIEEAEVNSVFDSQLALSRTRAGLVSGNNATNGTHGTSSVRDLKVKLANDLVHVYLVLEVERKDVSVDLEGKLRSEGGYMQFEPMSGRIGALPVPQAVLAKVMEAIMKSPEAKEKLRLPPNMTDLKVENGEFVVVFN
jgi:hypothetical protein